MDARTRVLVQGEAKMKRRTLVAGWFSFELMGASAGDLMARDVACEWLREAAMPYDIALAPPFAGGVNWRGVDPNDYSHLLFVCGPLGNGPPVDEMLQRFSAATRVGLNLTMLHRLDQWNPFDLLWARDSSVEAQPDLALAASAPSVPVVGLLLIDHQPEYGSRDRRHEVDAAFDRLLKTREAAVVSIDTRLDENKTGLRTPSEVAALISRLDVVLTTRLHGTVLAIKAGVPPLVVDSIAGGAKVSRQAERLGWPALLKVEELTDEALERAFSWCLTSEARSAAIACRDRALGDIDRLRNDFVSALKG
jgi:hypothetical protein